MFGNGTNYYFFLPEYHRFIQCSQATDISRRQLCPRVLCHLELLCASCLYEIMPQLRSWCFILAAVLTENRNTLDFMYQFQLLFLVTPHESIVPCVWGNDRLPSGDVSCLCGRSFECTGSASISYTHLNILSVTKLMSCEISPLQHFSIKSIGKVKKKFYEHSMTFSEV